MVVEETVVEDVTVVEGPAVVADVVVEVVQLDPDMALPDYARAADAGADIRASADVTIAPGGGRALVPTGLAIAIPEGYAGFVQPRSGLALDRKSTRLNSSHP
jgi:dUTP pyrophosphatase